MITNTEGMKAALRERITLAGLEGPVLCDGAFHAQVAIIAEAPGEREVETKRPLVGGSGSKLWEVLRPLGINRTDVYVTNVCKRQVSLGKDKRHPINRHEMESWIGLLHWELSQLPNLKYVLVLGNIALQALTGHSGITDWRGSVIDAQLYRVHADGTESQTVKAVLTYNPAMILRDPKLEITFKFDCAKLRKVMDDKYTIVPVQSIINPSYADATDYLDMLEQEGDPVAYDIESISQETACIGFANNSNSGICINWRTRDDAAYDLPTERNLRRRVGSFLRSPNVRLVAQNGMFDASWLAFKDHMVVKPHYFDTMLAHHLVYPLLPHGLGYLTTQYTTRPYYKDELGQWREDGDINSFWHYNVQDCCNTWAAHIGLMAELKSQKLDAFFFDHVMRLQPSLIRMTVGGVLIDTAYKEELVGTLQTQLIDLLGEFHTAVKEATGLDDYYPNPASVKDMSELLFSKLRLVGRGVSTDAENRRNMFSHASTTEPKRAVIRALDMYKEEQKFYSTYANSKIDEDHRYRSTYNQTGVSSAPGRLSSSGMLWGTGGNLQNQPERAHGMFIADPGYGLGYFDMAQAEARYVGWCANITKWIEQFERARVDGLYDAHRALASEMFGIPYDDVPTFDRYNSSNGHPPPEGKRDGSPTVRYISKRCRHGLNYRMGPDRLAAVTGLSLAEAMNAYRIYHRLTPELAQWWADVEKEVREHRSLYNVYGRRWLLMERISPEALEAIVAFKPQSSVGDHVSRVIYMSEHDERWPTNARIALNNHDSLVALAPKHRLQKCMSIMKKYAEEPLNVPYRERGVIKHRPLIIPAETKISYENERGYHSWGSLKKIDIEAAA